MLEEVTNDAKKIIELKNKYLPIFNNPNFGQDLPIEQCIILFSTFLTPQSYGPRLEKYIRNKIGALKDKNQKDCGDCNLNGVYYEIKSSIITQTNSSLNMVQIRPHQKCNYCCAYFDIRGNFKYVVYKLMHEQMCEEIRLLGGNAHGTKKANSNNENIEKRISLVIDDNNDDFKRWNEKYIWSVSL